MCDGCSSHGACKALGGGKQMEVEALNMAQAQPGDQVLLTLEGQSLMRLSFLVYLFPILALLLGAAIGQELAPALEINREWASFGLAAIFFGLAFALVKLKDKKFTQTGQTIPKVARIIKEGR